jgi:SsrA-binding protein
MKSGFSKVYIKNKKASFEYNLLERFEAGIALKGAEIKSIRMGGADLTNSFISIDKSLEVYTVGIKIRKPKTINLFDSADFNPERPKKLLLKKREILKLAEKVKEKGFSIIPTSLYCNKRGFAKLEIWIATGKKNYDKRKALKEKDEKRRVRSEKNASI